jgi:ferritin-like metal-binding protein YciE
MKKQNSPIRARLLRAKGGSKKAEASKKDQLKEFFIEELKDIYWAEKHLVKALPKMKKAATTQELKDAFEDHLNVTEGQVKRLEEVFELMDEKPVAKKCEAMAGLSKEADEIMKDTETGSFTRDVALILAAQKVEHYEIATYGSLAQLAQTLDETDVEELLKETLEEEKEADSTLTGIAESHINEDALQEKEEAEVEEE